jgi:Fur family transcriptional regulator, ferric uptake regulator
MTHPPHGHSTAPSADDWTAHTIARVAAAGHRSGGARRAVIESLADQDCCRSAQEIFDDLRSQGRRVGVASVYRVVDLLVNLGLVLRLDLGDGVARYEPALPSGKHHHHIVCVVCGDVRPFEDPRLERALEVASASSDHIAVDAHDVVLRGHCASCRET